MAVWDVIHKYQLGDVALACLFYIITIIISSACEPHCRAFQWDDARIANPPHDDTFPNSSLVVMIFVTPLAYIGCEMFVVKYVRQWTAGLRHRPSVDGSTESSTAGERAAGSVRPTQPTYGGSASATTVVVADEDRPRGDDEDDAGNRGNGWVVTFAWVRTHIFAVALQAIVVDVLKMYCGRLRPDYLSRLAAAGFTATTKGIPDPVTDPRFYCDLMKTYPALKEGRLSFPSGHSGISFSVFVVVTLYVFSHLRPFAFQGSFCRLCLSMLPMTVPVFCAASRTRDNKHHFSDIVAGSLIGAVAALIAFHCCFRSAGGPVAAIRARVENDVEYLHWRRSVRAGASSQELQRLTNAAAAPPRGLPVLSEAELNADPATVSWV